MLYEYNLINNYNHPLIYEVVQILNFKTMQSTRIFTIFTKKEIVEL